MPHGDGPTAPEMYFPCPELMTIFITSPLWLPHLLPKYTSRSVNQISILRCPIIGEQCLIVSCFVPPDRKIRINLFQPRQRIYFPRDITGPMQPANILTLHCVIERLDKF